MCRRGTSPTSCPDGAGEDAAEGGGHTAPACFFDILLAFY